MTNTLHDTADDTTGDTTNDTTNDTTDHADGVSLSMEELSAIRPGDGQHLHFLNHLATIKVAAGSSTSGMNAVEFTAPRGFGPPLHIHREEDELMYVLDGDVRVDLGETSQVVSAGGVVSLPHGIPHVFQVLSETARMLTVAAGRSTAPSFDRFVAELGDPIDPQDLPAPIAIDPGRVGAIGAAHGIEILGPPPAPLD